MNLATTRNIGPALCDLFGIDPNTTTELSIHIEPDQIIRVQATMYATEEQMGSFLEIVKRYHMEPLPNGTS